MKIKFKKIYQYVKEGEIPNAIVCFRKRPWSIYLHNGGTDGGGRNILSYKKQLVLNLWFVELWFEWIKEIN